MFPARRRDRPVESQASPRAAWYDRNPSTAQADYNIGNIAPHSSTVRMSYTCPSGKKAMLEAVTLHVVRNTAPTTAGRAEYSLMFQTEVILGAAIRGNAVGDKDSATLGQSVVMLAGNSIDFVTSDTSTGGTVDYWAGYKVTTFDA